MAEDIGALVVRIEANLKDFQKGVNQVTKKTEGFSKTVKKIGGVIAGAFAVKAIVSFGKTMITAASDATEMQSKFNTVFGEMSKTTEDWAKDFQKSVGGSRIEIKSMLADSADLLAGFGATEEQAFDLSTRMHSLGTDIASFSNIQGGAEEAVTRLRKGLMGETENLKALGIVINQTMLQNELASKGDTRKLKDLSELEKMELRYTIAVRQSALAIGDAEKTSGGFANQIRNLKGRIKDFTASLGMKLLPIATKVVTFFVDSFPKIEATINTTIDIVTKTFKNGYKILLQIIKQIDNNIVQPFIAAFTNPFFIAENALQNVFNSIGIIFQNFSTTAKSVFENLKATFDWVMNNVIVPFREGFVNGFTEMQNKTQTTFAFIGDIIQSTFSLFKDLWENQLGILISTISGLLALIRGDYDSFFDYITDINIRLQDNFNKIIDFFNSYGIDVIAIFTNIKNKIIDAWNLVIEIITPLIKAFSDSFMVLIDSLRPAWESLMDTFEVIIPTMKNIWTLVKPLVILLGGIFVAFMGIAVGALNAIIRGLGPFLEAITNVINIITNIFSLIIALIVGDWATAWESFKNILSNAFGFVENIFKTIDTVISGFFDGIFGYFESFFNLVNTAIEKINIFNKKEVKAKTVPTPETIGTRGRRIPAFAKGSNFIPFDTAAFIHKGEAVIPADNNPSNPNAKNPIGGNNINYEGMFNGATFNIRSENDIKLIAREIYNLQQGRSRGNGVVFG